ncbi:transporter [Xanthomarina sp. GH4-25]|uniref:transporter n=1 Tax=Xanthomarina sp. GH4-25 TaxID=3349335 RepID=UPI0038782A09
MIDKKSKVKFILVFINLLVFSMPVFSQGDGPRAHLPSPKNVWAINPKYLHLDQNLLPNGNILVENADINVDVFPTTLVHTFNIKGKFARVFAMINPGSLTATGNFEASSLQVSKELSASGFSDGFVAFEYGLIGSPALNALEFAKHEPQFSLNGFLRYWYSGTYDSNKLINLGTNRSTFEIGTTMAIPFHKNLTQNATWLEIMPTVQFYTDNNDPARSSRANKVEQKPLFIIENHLTHNLNKKLWVGADLRYQVGGETEADGVSDDNHINILGGGLNLGYQIIAPLSAFVGYDTIIFGDNNARSNMLRVSLVFAYINLKKIKASKTIK